MDLKELKLAIVNLFGGTYEDYSFLYLARQYGGKPIKNLDILCPKLIKVEGTLIWFICESYLEWAILIDSGKSEAIKDQCLYSPFIDDMLQFQFNNILHIDDLIKNIINSINVMKKERVIRYSEFLKNREENNEQ